MPCLVSSGTVAPDGHPFASGLGGHSINEKCHANTIARRLALLLQRFPLPLSAATSALSPGTVKRDPLVPPTRVRGRAGRRGR
jgi:hypothetical protein